jgi:hypothetical protein
VVQRIQVHIQEIPQIQKIEGQHLQILKNQQFMDKIETHQMEEQIINNSNSKEFLLIDLDINHHNKIKE